MISHVWSVLCARAFIDKDGGSICMVAAEQATIGGLPEVRLDEMALELNLELLSLWADPEGLKPFDVRVEIIGPEGNALDGQQFPATWDQEASYKRYRTRLKIPAIRFRGFGWYWFTVSLKTDTGMEEQARVPLEVVEASAVSD